MEEKLTSNSPIQTKRLSREILKSRPHIVALTGDLGSGKTTFVQGLARALGIRRRITSPTFIIWNRHKIPQNKRLPWTSLYHVDCYRIQSPSEFVKLGFKDLLRNTKNLVLIEWAERVKKLLPKDTLWIQFAHGDNSRTRHITIHARNTF